MNNQDNEALSVCFPEVHGIYLPSKAYVRIKNKRLRIRKVIFTNTANDGAPPGQTWPNKTTRFRIIRIIRMNFLTFVITQVLM